LVVTVVTTLACPVCRIAIASPETHCPRDGQQGQPVVWNTVPAPLGKRFRVLEPFAHGATGSMYLADESESGQRGLLKVLANVPKHREPERARLRRELSKQATLEAGGRLVVPWASGESEATTWLFRPWLDGVSLRVRIMQGPALPMLDALAIASQLATALDELHRGGLLHRDLKPGHVFLQTSAPSQPRASLIEPGVCGSIARPGNSTIFGTPGYVAPEQLLGKLVSFRSDLYSLGCVMYEMLAGHPPFQGDTDQAIMAAQLTGDLPPLPASVPEGILTLLRSLLAREPQERPFSAQKLRRILDPYAPQGAPMTRQPTSTFATVPESDKPGMPQAETPFVRPSLPPMPPSPPPAAMKTSQAMFSAPGASKPPMHRPTVRGVAPPPPPRASRAPVYADPTQHLELDHIEEFTDAETDGHDRTQELSPEHLEQVLPEPAHPSASPKGFREDHTVPVRLDQILSMAPANLRASAGASAPPPPMEQPEPVAPLPKPSAVPNIAGITAVREPSLFDLAAHNGPGAQGARVPAAGPIDSTILADEASLSDVAALTVQPVRAASTSSLSPPSSSLFAALPEPTRDPLYESAFGLADDEDEEDSSESEQTKVAAKPERPHAAAAASTSLDDDATRVHPSNRPPALDDSSSDLSPRALQDTLHPYLGGNPKARRKLMMYGGAAAGLLLLVWGVGALTGDDAEALAQRDASPAPAAAIATPPPLPAPTVEPTPSVITLDKGAAANEKPVAEAPKAQAEVPAAEVAQAVVAAQSTPSEQPKPSAQPAPVREQQVAAIPRKANGSGARNAREDRRRERREAKERVQASRKTPAKKADASADRASKWAAARDEARAHYAAKRYKQAAQAYERASTFDPTNAGTFAGLGAARLQAGDGKGAVAAYQRAVQLSPSSAGFHLALGRAYLAAGDKTKAKAAYKRALAIDPKNESAKSSLKELGG